MSTLNQLFDLPERICHVQCGFCTTILLVSVPFSSLSMVVTVRCGHCTSLLSVNMMKASFVPLHLLASLASDDEQPKEKVGMEEADAWKRNLEMHSPSMVTSSDNEEENMSRTNQVVNKPPEKRQRAPSAYNCFIKEEIRRLKAQNPNMAHKEAFSMAAKNWAYLPPRQHKSDAECLSQEDETAPWNSDSAEGCEEGNGFRGRKAPRNSIWEKLPLE